MTPTHAISADEARRLLAEDRARHEKLCATPGCFYEAETNCEHCRGHEGGFVIEIGRKAVTLVCSDCEEHAEAGPGLTYGDRHVGCSGKWWVP